jgi:hypothetical protein
MQAAEGNQWSIARFLGNYDGMHDTAQRQIVSLSSVFS